MPAITPPDQTEIDLLNIRERGVRDGSSPVERFEINGSSAERTFFVAWDTRDEFVWWMLGYAETWDDAGTTRLSRLLPQVHPLYSDLVATRCTRIKGHKWLGNNVADVGGEYQFPIDGTQVNKFKEAEVTILYEHAPYDRVEDDDIYSSMTEFDRYVSRGEVQPGAEYLQLPGAAFRYWQPSGTAAPDGFPIPFNAGKILPQERFTLTWHRLPENVWTPDSGLYDYIYGVDTYATTFAYGGINKTTFYGRKPGTVLLEGVRPILNRSPFGVGFEWDLEFSFAYNPRGFNYLYYWPPIGGGGTPGWYFVGKSGYYAPGSVPDDESMYNERDFSLLFSVDN